MWLDDELDDLNDKIHNNAPFQKLIIDINDNLLVWIGGVACLCFGISFFYFLFKSGVEMYFVFDKKRQIFEVYKVNIFGEYIEEYSFQDISHIKYEDNLNDDDAQPKGPHVMLKSGKKIDMITFGSLDDREYIASLIKTRLELK